MQYHFSSLWQYFIEALKKYHESQSKNFFRIVDIDFDKSNQRVVTVQLIGSATVFKCTLQEILSHDQILEGFSKKEIRTLTYFATLEAQDEKYNVCSQEVTNKNRLQFKLKKRGSSECIEKTAQQISLDNDLLEKLNPKDAHLIGYTTATEQMFEERKIMEKLNQSKPII